MEKESKEKELSMSSLLRMKPAATKPKKPAGKKIPPVLGKTALGKKKQAANCCVAGAGC